MDGGLEGFRDLLVPLLGIGPLCAAAAVPVHSEFSHVDVFRVPHLPVGSPLPVLLAAGLLSLLLEMLGLQPGILEAPRLQRRPRARCRRLRFGALPAVVR